MLVQPPTCIEILALAWLAQWSIPSELCQRVLICTPTILKECQVVQQGPCP